MPAPWRFLPCSSCCGCVIFTDDFDRAEIGSDWEAKSGTWSIEANQLKGCGTGTRILWTGPEELTDNFSIHTQVTFSAEGQKARVFFGGDETESYYVEFETGSIVNPGTSYAYYPIHVRVFDPDGVQIGATNDYTVSSGSYGPLFIFLCIWDEKPSCLKLTFDGFGGGPCMMWGDWEGCHCLNRSIYLTDNGTCTWRVATVWADYCFNSTSLYTGGIAYWEADIRYTDGHYWLYLTLYAGYLGARTTYWRADLGEDKPEAMALDVTDFELIVDQVSDICDISNVTLHIEAVDGDPCPPQQNRCLACGPQCGDYPPEIRLQTSGFDDAEENGDFILGPGFIDWYHCDCVWSYSGDVTWYVRFVYSKQSPASINVFVDHGGYWDGVYGSQTWPIDCSNFTITLTSGTKTAIISNV